MNWDLNPSTVANGNKGTAFATISVADLYQLVKQHDKAFNPRPSSLVVNEDGTPKVVYYGTNAKDIEVFDNESGAYWFSDSYDYAEAMAEERGGKTVLQMYLNMSTKKCTSPNG